MDTFQCISTKLELKEYATRPVSADTKREVLEAARLTASGVNAQHWRFVLVQGPEGIRTLARDSTTGKWVASADFAVLVLTDPKYKFHAFDAGRVVQDMQLAAWNRGVASRVYTGYDKGSMASDFALPSDLDLTAVVGFGYPTRKVVGRKNRLPLSQIAYFGRFGQALSFQS